MTALLALAPTLDTDRLTLTAPTTDDLSAYVAFYGRDERTLSYPGGLTPEEAAAVLDADIDAWRTKGFGIWLIRRRGEDEVVGAAGLAHEDGWPCAELTWWLFPEARGAGYAAEASRAVVAFAYDALGWDRVETYMRDENGPARRLAERLGGKVDRRIAFPDGHDRDVYLIPPAGRP
ncbi:MAG: GNAT family N-acetyltransferase [Pseudomonadota bacterium]